MEHVTTALYMAGALGIFLMAFTLLTWYGRCIDTMFELQGDIQMPGQVVETESVIYE
jgi:hypothetical protein